VEADGAVTLSAALIKPGEGGYFDLPQINGGGVIGSVCTVPNNIEAAIRGAVYDVIRRVETDHHVPFMDAYMLAGQCVKIRICQMTSGACTAYACLDKSLLNAPD
jgi:acetamidase/formamidase